MAAEKFLQHDNVGGVKEVQGVIIGGAPSADRIPSLNPTGQLDITMMPTGIGADTAVLPAAGALVAGDFVNIFDDNGVIRCRKADASSIATKAMGYVLTAVADLANATVYSEGSNTQVSGQVGGEVFLSTTAGLVSNVVPSASTEIVQVIGIAVSPTQVNFNPQTPILLA